MNPSPAGGPALPDLDDGLAVHLSELGRHRPLAPEEEERLARAARTGDRAAAARLVEANLSQVISVARCYAGRGVPLLDLAQEGGIALMQAVEGFEPARGRFSSHAHWCIRQAVRRAATERGLLIRLPPATAAAIERLRGTVVHLAETLGREATPSELAVELSTTPQRVTRLSRLACMPRTADHLGSGLRAGAWPISRSLPDDVLLAALRVDLYAMLARLSARERRVLHLRLGVMDGRRCALAEVGRRLGLSPERIREIEAKALTKLRHATDEPSLAGSLE